MHHQDHTTLQLEDPTLRLEGLSFLPVYRLHLQELKASLEDHTLHLEGITLRRDHMRLQALTLHPDLMCHLGPMYHLDLMRPQGHSRQQYLMPHRDRSRLLDLTYRQGLTHPQGLTDRQGSKGLQDPTRPRALMCLQDLLGPQDPTLPPVLMGRQEPTLLPALMVPQDLMGILDPSGHLDPTHLPDLTFPLAPTEGQTRHLGNTAHPLIMLSNGCNKCTSSSLRIHVAPAQWRWIRVPHRPTSLRIYGSLTLGYLGVQLNSPHGQARPSRTHLTRNPALPRLCLQSHRRPPIQRTLLNPIPAPKDRKAAAPAHQRAPRPLQLQRQQYPSNALLPRKKRKRRLTPQYG